VQTRPRGPLARARRPGADKMRTGPARINRANPSEEGLPRKSPFHPLAGGQPPMSILLGAKDRPNRVPS
jgi:hypothetical protein